MISILATSAGYAQFYLLVSVCCEISLEATGFAFSLMILSNLLPISVGGIGVRESVAALVLHSFGVDSAAAINAAFLSYVTNTVVPGLVGAALLASTRAGRGKRLDLVDAK